MTDPAPGAGDDTHHEPQDQDIAATSVSSAPTGSSPPQATEVRPIAEDAGGSRGGAEPEQSTEDDGQSEEGDSEEEEEEESEESEEDDEDEDDDDDEDEEPRLKYARLTQHLGGVYKNADATSSFLVAGDKMVVGTHNGNIVCTLDLLIARSTPADLDNSMSSNCLPSNPSESTMRTPPLSLVSPFRHFLRH